MIKRKNLAPIILIYLALKPIYLWSSGGMQICDIFLVISTLYLIITFRGKFIFSRHTYKAIALFFGLCIYQLFINIIWTVVLGENLLKNTLYYFFNFIAFFDLIIICNETGLDPLKRNIGYGSLISLGISTIGLIAAEVGGRRVGFFNNPNQLGYYALAVFSFGFLCKDSIKRVFFYFIIILSTWAVIASGSKAAFLAVIIMYALLIIFYNKERSIKNLIIQIMILVILSFALYLFFFSNSSIVVSNPTILFMRRRMLQMQTENDTALGSGRGYDRIMETGIHFLWGVGEGANSRFQSMTGMEAHSSFVTLFVSYGLFGLIGYFVLFVRCIKQRDKVLRNLFILSGMLFYSVSHNGLRNTLLWLLIALLFMDNNDLSYGVDKDAVPYDNSWEAN